MMEFKCIGTSSDLPPEWDGRASNYFQQRKFLKHTETYNPCNQRFYLCQEDAKLIAAAIVYTLRIDLLTFIKVKSPFKMQIVGIPCSVSSPGIFGEAHGMEALKKHIFKVEKGLVLVLNLEKKPLGRINATGCTLPSIVMANHFATWNDYVDALRSNYRRRLHQINNSGVDLQIDKLECLAFTEEMYTQYLAVFKRSSGKLEMLTMDFFKNLPAEFILTACYRNDNLLGWNLALSHQKTYYFFLGGIDYNYHKTYRTYFRLLSSLLKDGIERKADLIELGQTAEIPKMRMGGMPIPLFMEAHHSILIFNRILILFSKLLDYKLKAVPTNPFKEPKK